MGEIVSVPREETRFKMRPFGLLVIGAAYATEERLDPSPRTWGSNSNAPYCGMQIITTDHNMINSTCIAEFFGKKVHMISVASSFAIPELSDVSNFKYAWTSYDGNSHANLHDILVFFEPESCCEGWEFGKCPLPYNATVPDVEEDSPTITCTDNGSADPNVRLGNFNYDIARSVQRYNVSVKNLAQDNSATIMVNGQNEVPLLVKNVSAHHGHGVALVNGGDCNADGTIVFQAGADHEGDLEYFQFELCDAECHGPNEEGALDDYCFEVPSPWATTVTL